MEKRLQEITNLINDSCSKRVAMYADEKTAGYADEGVREAIFEILGDRKLTWAGWRNHKNEIYTIMEVVLNTNLPLAWETSPFYIQCVQTANGALGDKNEFIVEDDSILVASTFSGNHWDTDRKKIGGRKAFSLNTEWFYIHLYADFERFLKGLITIPELIAKMQKAMQNAIDDRIVTSFNAAGTYLPTDFVVTGTYDRAAMMKLIQKVQTATRKNVFLAGTRLALSSIVNGSNADWISNSQKEEFATTGLVLAHTGLGCVAVEIPQSFARGTYDFDVSDNAIFVLPDGEKFIKVYFEGDTRAREVGMTDTHDQTIDTQIQTKVGVGCVFGNVFGKYVLNA